MSEAPMTSERAQPSAQEGTSRRKINYPYFLIRHPCGCLSGAWPDRPGEEEEIGAMLIDSMREGLFVARVVLTEPVTIGGDCALCKSPARKRRREQAHGA